VKPRHKRKRKINDRFKVSLDEPKVFGSENRIEFHFEAKALAYVKQKKRQETKKYVSRIVIIIKKKRKINKKQILS